MSNYNPSLKWVSEAPEFFAYTETKLERLISDLWEACQKDASPFL